MARCHVSLLPSLKSVPAAENKILVSSSLPSLSYSIPILSLFLYPRSAGSTHGSRDPGSQREEAESNRGVCACSPILQGPLSSGALRPVFHTNCQRRHPVGHYCARHLEAAGKAVHETSCIQGLSSNNTLHPTSLGAICCGTPFSGQQ